MTNHESVFILCRDGEDQHERYELTASHDKGTLENEAARLNLIDDDAQRAAAAASGGAFGFLERDDPRRGGYCKFYVIEVPIWPRVAK